METSLTKELLMPTKHYERVREFMQGCQKNMPKTAHLQATPSYPLIPPPEVRLRRAKLIMEEALETVQALGVDMTLRYHGAGAAGMSRWSLSCWSLLPIQPAWYT